MGLESKREVRDVVHGVIQIESHELPVLDSHLFQRLRQIRQTGFAEHSYPGSTHNRFSHSLGALQTVTESFQSIFAQNETIPSDAKRRFLAVVRFAALLHDVGHGPLSHTTEFAMPQVSELLPDSKEKRKATHEDYTLKIILSSPMTRLLERAGSSFEFSPLHIAALIDQNIILDESYFECSVNGQIVNFRRLLSQLISSELDADRMDYLRRDSYYCGVNYGVFDYSWIIRNLCFHIKEHKAYLALNHRALYAFEDFLLARFNMFLQVYLHHKTVIYDEMLAKYLNDPACDYRLPTNLEDYTKCTDSELYSHLSESSNQWARRIVEKRPLKMYLEIHSGIPNALSARQEQERLFAQTCSELDRARTEYIATKSVGYLSKYFSEGQGSDIFIRYNNLLSEPIFIPLHDCTTLFTQYPNSRSISRIFMVNLEA